MSALKRSLGLWESCASPSEWRNIVSTTRKHCQTLTINILNPSNAPCQKTLYEMDEISNAYSKLMNTAEYIHTIESSPEWLEAASDTIRSVGTDMHAINRNPGLKRLFDDLQNKSSGWSPEHQFFIRDMLIDCSVAQEEPLYNVKAAEADVMSGFALETDLAALRNLNATSDSSDDREFAFYAAKGCIESLFPKIDRLRDTRHGLAIASGFCSFTDLKLQRSLFKSSTEVLHFLKLANDSLSDQLDAEPHVKESDYAYSLRNSRALLDTPIVPLGAALESIFHITEREFGVRLTQGDNNNRLEAFSQETGEQIGYVILDLHRTSTKRTAPMHVNLQNRFSSPYSNQMQISAILCGFPDDKLSFRSMQTLFHEFGHLIHALVGESEFQHSAGIRAPMDFVEIPASYFELLLESDAVMSSLFSNSSIIALRHVLSQYRASMAQKSISQAIVDQLLFNGSCGSAKEAFELAKSPEFNLKYPGLIELGPGHLVGYGGEYYAYVLAECLAARFFDLNDDSFARMLKRGHSQETTTLISDALGMEFDPKSLLEAYYKHIIRGI